MQLSDTIHNDRCKGLIGLSLVAFQAVLLVIGCDGGRQASVRAELQPVPRIPTSDVGELTKQHLQKARDQLVVDLGDDQINNADLGSAFGTLGQLFQTYELYDEAAVCYENAVVLRPDDYRWPYYLGQVFLVYRDLSSARHHFSTALLLAPDDVPSRVSLGRTLQETGDIVGAERLFREAIALDTSCAVGFFHLAQIEADRGDLTAAIEHYNTVLDLQPEATRTYLPLAVLYRRLGNEKLAAETLGRKGDGVVGFTDPLMYELTQLAFGIDQFLNRGLEAHRDERIVEARSWFEKAVAAAPGNSTARLNLGAVLEELGQTREAETQLRVALEIDPEMAGAHFNLGSILAGEGREAEAIECYRAALRLAPDYYQAQFNLANALRRTGEYHEAAEFYRLVLEDDPSNLGARRGEARALALAGREALAVDLLEASHLLTPNDPGLRHDLARLLATASDDELRNGDRSLALISPLVQGGRVLPDYIETLAMAQAARGDFDRARAFQKSLIASAEKAGLVEIAAGFRANLERYEKGLPAHANWK